MNGPSEEETSEEEARRNQHLDEAAGLGASGDPEGPAEPIKQEERLKDVFAPKRDEPAPGETKPLEGANEDDSANWQVPEMTSASDEQAAGRRSGGDYASSETFGGLTKLPTDRPSTQPSAPEDALGMDGVETSDEPSITPLPHAGEEAGSGPLGTSAMAPPAAPGTATPPASGTAPPAGPGQTATPAAPGKTESGDSIKEGPVGGPAAPASTERLQGAAASSTQKLSTGSSQPGTAAGAESAVTDKADKTAAKPSDEAPTEAMGQPRSARRGPVLDSKERKRKRLVPIILLLLGVVAAAVAMATMRDEKAPSAADKDNPTTTASPTPGATNTQNPLAKVGEEVERGNFKAKVLAVRRKWVPTNPLEVPEAGMKIVAVEFEVTNQADHGVILSSPRQFKVRDSANTLYDFSPTGAPDPRFPDGPLGPGQTVRGWLAFKVPEAATGLRLVFNASVERAP